MATLAGAGNGTEAPGKRPHPDMVWIPGGTFWMGSQKGYEEERPEHQASVDGFWMDTRQVTTGEYARFVDATGWVTNAEQAPSPEDYPNIPREMLRVGSGVFIQQPGREIRASFVRGHSARLQAPRSHPPSENRR